MSVFISAHNILKPEWVRFYSPGLNPLRPHGAVISVLGRELGRQIHGDTSAAERVVSFFYRLRKITVSTDSFALMLTCMLVAQTEAAILNIRRMFLG